MPAYTFDTVMCTITGWGPGGLKITLPLSGGVGAAKEGIKFSAVDDKNVMVKGADGSTQHSKKAGNAANCEVALQHVAAINAALMEMFNFQDSNPQFWGDNVIVVADFARGDYHQLVDVAFVKAPDENYADEAGNRTWPFHVGTRDSKIGPGRPEV